MLVSAALLFTSVDTMTVRAEELGDIVPPALEEANPGDPEDSENPDIVGDGDNGQEEHSYVKNEADAVIIRSFGELTEKQAYIKLEEREELSEVVKRMPAELTVYVDEYVQAEQPGEGEDQPVEGEDQPGEGDDQPAEGEDQPVEGGDQPVEGEDQPSEGEDQPGGGENQPGEGENQPGEGEDQPGTGGDQPDGGEDQPGTGGDQPVEGEGQPSEGNDQPVEGEDQSGEGGDQPVQDGGDADDSSGGENSQSDSDSDQPGTSVAAVGINGAYAVDGSHQWHLLVAAENGANTYDTKDEGGEGTGGAEGGTGEGTGGTEGGTGEGTGGTEGGTGEGTGGTEDSTGGNEGGPEDSTGDEGGGTGGNEGGGGTDVPGTGEGENTPPGIEPDDGTDVPVVEKPDTVPPEVRDTFETVEIPVTWKCDTYETEETDSYLFVPEWDETKWVLAESGKDTIPTIEVVYVKPESMVSTEEELVAAFEAGIGKITLQNDIKLTKPLKLPATADIILDGQGYSLLRGKAIVEGEEGQSAEIFSGIMIAMEGEDYTKDTYGTLTLKNITVNGSTETKRADAPAILDRGNLILDEGAVVRDNYNYGTYPKEGEDEKEAVPDYGGGIQVYGKLTLSSNALVTENYADEFGGGVYLAEGATLYLYADGIVKNGVSEDAGYGADLYAAKGSTIYYDPSSIDMKEKREKGLFYICSGVKLFRLGEGDQEPEQEDTNKELYIYVDKDSGYDDTQIAELKDELRMYGYTILEGRTDIDTSDLKDWYVYDHYDTACWGTGTTDNPPSGWSAAYPSGGSQKRKFYPCTETHVTVPNVDTIEAWLASGSKYLAKFKEHIYVRKEGGDTAMTFVGYGEKPHVDFMYYNPDSDGEKVVDFDVNSVAIDTHTLFGNGFLVNTGVGADGNMAGYLILYRYQNTVAGALANRLELYRIQGTPEVLHEGALTRAARLIESREIDSSEWQNQMSVQIRVTPKRIVVRQQPYGVGKDISQTKPVLEYSIADESGYSGFGPLVAYGDHDCGSASSFTYSDLCMYYTNPQMEKDNLLSSLEKADFTQEGTQKYFIDLFGQSKLNFDDSMNMGHLYHEYMKLMQTEGVALVTDRKTPFAEYLGEAGGSGSNLYELGEGGALPNPKELAEQIHERIKDKISTRLEEKVNRGELQEPEPKSSAGNICLQSAKAEQIRKTLYGDDFAEGGYQIQIIDDADIAYDHSGSGSATYEILKPNAADYETLGRGTMGSGFSFTIPKTDAERAQWPAGVYTVRQTVDGSGIDGYAYFTLKWRAAPPPTYSVAVNVRKDGEPWTNHGKAFWLRGANGGTYTCGQVVAGTYYVLENSTNTGVRVTVTNRNTSVTVDYYTVTFYDREPGDPDTKPYESNTSWRPLILLKDRVIGRLMNPDRDKFSFTGWVFEDGTPFDSYSSKIDKTTNVYATWSRNLKVNVNVRKDNNSWDDHGRVFRLLAEGGTELIGLSDVESEGKYIVYDVTGLEDVTSPREDRNTGETVEVTAAETNTPNTLKEATVDYYTVAFYDEYPGGGIYGDDTEQAQQIVLKGQKAGAPSAPARDKFSFTGWVKDDGSAAGEKFEIDRTEITEPVNLYATWEKIVEPRYQVIINPRKDGATWQDSGRVFALRPEGVEGEIVYDLAQVKKGIYRVYDITGGNSAVYRTRAAGTDLDVKVGDGDTGVTVKVEENDVTEIVNYYTVTFYDGNRAYGTDTPQHPMIALKGKKAEKPEEPPRKSGYRFIGWMTERGGSTEFDFDQPVENKTDIFASFRADAKSSGDEEIIENTPDGGGDIQTITVSQEAETLPQPQTEGEPATDGKEPKTGDAMYVEIYATVAMIAGLTYLLLYFMEEGGGMTEREKEVFVAAFIRWAKKGGRFRRCCAIVAIFCLLVYYHSIGKRAGKSGFDREYLRQAL